MIEKVDRYESEDETVKVSTIKVTDGREPYETAVSHPLYNNGDWVIVECYSTKEEAKASHKKWVEAITTEPLPDKLVDCSNAEISQLAESFGSDTKFLKEEE